MMRPSTAVQKLSFANAIVNIQPMNQTIPKPVSTRTAPFDATEDPLYSGCTHA